MKPNISEFSYGYALTENLIEWVGEPLKAAPVFPSLIQEGRSGGGYDLELQFPSIPLFLQFKLSDHMVRATVQECSKYKLFEPPFYRMHLRPLKHSQQHTLLLDLEKNNDCVFYVAPAFHNVAQLNEYYVSREVVARSVFFRPSAIGALPDEKDHYVAFKVQDWKLPLQIEAYRLSHPMPVEVESDTMLQRRLLERLHELEIQNGSTHQALTTLYHQMLGILQERLDLVDQQLLHGFGNNNPLRGAAYLARMYFECEMFLISLRQPTA